MGRSLLALKIAIKQSKLSHSYFPVSRHILPLTGNFSIFYCVCPFIKKILLLISFSAATDLWPRSVQILVEEGNEITRVIRTTAGRKFCSGQLSRYPLSQ